MKTLQPKEMKKLKKDLSKLLQIHVRKILLTNILKLDEFCIKEFLESEDNESLESIVKRGCAIYCEQD